MATDGMQGLDPDLPTEIGVDFLGTPVVVSRWRVNVYGLATAVPAGDGEDLYFVPWSRLKYAKQHKTIPAA